MQVGILAFNEAIAQIFSQGSHMGSAKMDHLSVIMLTLMIMTMSIMTVMLSVFVLNVFMLSVSVLSAIIMSVMVSQWHSTHSLTSHSQVDRDASNSSEAKM